MRRTVRIRICAVLIFLTLCFIWGNSLLSAELSEAFSDGIKSLLTGVPAEEAEPEEGMDPVRKLAHFAEFALLGFLLSWLYRLIRRPGWYPALWGTLAGCIDETIQMFVPERGPGLLDVGIDACGVLMGMILLHAAYFLKRKQTTSTGG